MNKIKVAWDNSLARKNRTGTGIYAACLLGQLVSRADVTIEVFDGWPNSSGPRAVVSRAFHTAGNLVWTHVHLPLLLRKRNFDLLHSPAFTTPIVSPCPTVITVHDLIYLLYPMFFPRWWVTYLKSLMPVTTRAAAAIICPSAHSKSDIVNTYKLPSCKVHVVPQGVNHKAYHRGAALDRGWAREIGIREGYLLHVSDLSHRKNIPTLLRAVAHLRSKGKLGERQLVLAGAESPGMMGIDEIRKTIQQLDLSASVLLTGHVSDKRLPGLYAHASLFVMPSLYEGFGIPVLESMSAGTPVVASNISSLPEVAGDAAVLVAPLDSDALSNAIEDVLESKVLQSELRAKGLARASQFSWERTAGETLGVYQSVIGS